MAKEDTHVMGSHSVAHPGRLREAEFSGFLDAVSQAPDMSQSTIRGLASRFSLSEETVAQLVRLYQPVHYQHDQYEDPIIGCVVRFDEKGCKKL